MADDRRISRKIRGLFLIDKVHIEQLDELLAREFSSLEKQRSTGSNSRQSESSSLPEAIITERRVTIFNKKGDMISGQSFAEIARKPEILEFVPIGFEAFHKIGNTWCSIQLPHLFGPLNKLSIEIYPESEMFSRELFTLILTWARRIEKPAWLNWWYYLGGIQWALWGFYIWGRSKYVLWRVENRYLEDVKHLVESGVSQSNHYKALEMILAMQNGIYPRSYYPSGSVKKLLIDIAAFFIICLLMSFGRPQNTIGIGRGEQRLHNREKWIKWLAYIIPGALLAEVFLQQIWEYIIKVRG